MYINILRICTKSSIVVYNAFVKRVKCHVQHTISDDEEDVEALCQDVISDMETVLGEPLQKYF